MAVWGQTSPPLVRILAGFAYKPLANVCARTNTQDTGHGTQDTPTLSMFALRLGRSPAVVYILD